MTPNNSETPGVSAAAIADDLRELRELLTDPSPANIDRCRAVLSRGVVRLNGAAASFRETGNAAGMEKSLLSIRTELNAVASLLDSAATFRRDILRIVAATCCPPPLTSPSAGMAPDVPLHG